MLVQFRPLRHGNIQRILDPSAVNGNFSPIPEQQFHAAGVHVEMASSCIVLHVRFLLKSCCSLCRSIYDFGFHLPRTPALNFPKKTNNPNPSPIGNKFGSFLFGPSGENRTHGLLNPIQARYQNCATPGYLQAAVAHSSFSIPDEGSFVKHFFKNPPRNFRRWHRSDFAGRRAPRSPAPRRKRSRHRRPAGPGCRRSRWHRW